MAQRADQIGNTFVKSQQNMQKLQANLIKKIGERQIIKLEMTREK